MSFDWDVIRTTTDKLKDELNDLAWDVHLIQYIGGRDWVIIVRQDAFGPDLSQAIRGVARRTAVGDPQWEITIPSVGPNDEYLTAYAPNAAAIEAAAKKALADDWGVSYDEIQVDIDIDMRAP